MFINLPPQGLNKMLLCNGLGVACSYRTASGGEVHDIDGNDVATEKVPRLLQT